MIAQEMAAFDLWNIYPPVTSLLTIDSNKQRSAFMNFDGCDFFLSLHTRASPSR